MWTVRGLVKHLMALDPKAFVTHGHRDTVVTVLGWAGAADKNVEKYTDIYRKKGYTTVQFTAAPRPIGWGTVGSRKVANLAESLEPILANSSNRLVFHAFSMNGFLALASLETQFPELKVLEKCDGLFFDSCPGEYSQFTIENIYQHSQAMDHVYDSWIKDRDFFTSNSYRIFKKMETTRFGIRLILDSIWVKAGVHTLADISPYHYMVNHPDLPTVITSIFSDADSVINAEQVNAFNERIANRTDKKREVVSKRLSDSPHVFHFRKHPKLYMDLIDDFLQKVERVQSEEKGVRAKL